MAVALESNTLVVSTTGTVGDFTTLAGGSPNVGGDGDDTVTAAGGMGMKVSGAPATDILASDNLSGGASGVYDFSSGGADEGKHFIGWVNTKGPINTTTGIVVYVGNASGHFGRYNAMPNQFYKGGFVIRVKGMTGDFDTASTWTTTGNPAQLDDVSRLGFECTVLSSIMGNFNTIQVDQFCIGFGLRVDAGTSGVPNTFETVYVQDEDTSFWGWWLRSAARGRLYIGPETGTTASWFVDSAFVVSFAEEDVDVGFYGFHMRGANTTVTWTLGSIFSVNPTAARWSITLDSAMGDTTGGFTDNASVFQNYDVITLNANASLLGTTLIDGNSVLQNGATITGCTFSNGNGTELITADDYSLVTQCTYIGDGSGTPGHAVDLGNFGANDSVSWDSTLDDGLANADWLGTTGLKEGVLGDADDAILCDVDSGFTLTINVVAGATIPSVRNVGLGDVDVVSSVTLALSVIDSTGTAVTGTNARIEEIDGTLIAQGAASAGAGSNEFSTSYGGGSSTVRVKVRSSSGTPRYLPATTITPSSTGFNISVTLIEDTIAA